MVSQQYTTAQRPLIHWLAVISRVLLLAPLVSLGVYVYVFFGSDVPKLNPRNVLVVPRIVNNNVGSSNTADVLQPDNQRNYLHPRRGDAHGLSESGSREVHGGNKDVENVHRGPESGSRGAYGGNKDVENVHRGPESGSRGVYGGNKDVENVHRGPESGSRGVYGGNKEVENVRREPARAAVEVDARKVTKPLANRTVFKLIEFAASQNDPGKIPDRI